MNEYLLWTVLCIMKILLYSASHSEPTCTFFIYFMFVRALKSNSSWNRVCVILPVFTVLYSFLRSPGKLFLFFILFFPPIIYSLEGGYMNFSAVLFELQNIEACISIRFWSNVNHSYQSKIIAYFYHVSYCVHIRKLIFNVELIVAEQSHYCDQHVDLEFQ